MLHTLVDRIVAEVVRRVEEELKRQSHPERVLVLTGSNPVYPEKLDKWLADRYGLGFTEVRTGEHPPDRLKLAEMAGAAETVILAVPEIRTLRQIAAGEDTEEPAGTVVKAILWKKEVKILLDYEPPRFRSNTFFENIAGTLETLKTMGVSVEYYRTFQPAVERRQLVTEADVLAAAKTEEKTVWCTANAMITPLARDALRETGVLLDYKGGTACS